MSLRNRVSCRFRGREEGGTSGGHREPRSTPDWGPGALNGEHLWVPTSASGDFCYVNDCSVSVTCKRQLFSSVWLEMQKEDRDWIDIDGGY